MVTAMYFALEFSCLKLFLKSSHIPKIKAIEYLQNKHMMNDMVDPSLTSFQNNELQLICEVAQSCIHPDPQQRPMMKDIVSKLRDFLSISPNTASPKLPPLCCAELEIFFPRW